MNQQPEGNFYDKYNSQNYIVQKLMHGFFSSMKSMLDGLEAETILEAGCGEGHISNFLHQEKPESHIDAFDLSESVIEQARNDYPSINFYTGSVYDIQSADQMYDLVVASEVLEHLKEPEKALAELLRVSKKYVFISVPREPIWRVLNLCRGAYWSALGNTPGHIQHWSKKKIMGFMEKSGGGGRFLPSKRPFHGQCCFFKRATQNRLAGHT